MIKRGNIHNVDSLEREIYRLKLEAKNLEQRLDRNVTGLKDNFWDMCLKSVRFQKEDSDKSGLFNNEAINNAFTKVANHIAELAADGINTLLDKLFEKRS